MICFSYLSTGFDVWGPTKKPIKSKRFKKPLSPSGSTRSHSADTCATSWRTWNALGEGSLSCQVNCRRLWFHCKDFSRPIRTYGDMLGLPMFTIIYDVTRSYKYRLNGVMLCLLECMRFKGMIDIEMNLPNNFEFESSKTKFETILCCFCQSVSEKKRVYSEPILNPYQTHSEPVPNPLFWWENPGFLLKPRVFQTRTEPVLNPYFTRTNPLFFNGFEYPPGTSFLHSLRHNCGGLDCQLNQNSWKWC